MELRKDKTHFEMKKKLVVFHPAIAPYRIRSLMLYSILSLEMYWSNHSLKMS